VTDNQNPTPYEATAKAPTLIIGLLLILGGFLIVKGRWRYSLPIGAVLIAGGLGAVIYSTTIHEWCAPAGAIRWSSDFGAAFWHGPNAWDCWHAVNPLGLKGR
jgi:hypothetical protein